MMGRRQSLARTFLFIGLVLLMATLVGVVLLATRSFPRGMLKRDVFGAELVPSAVRAIVAIDPASTEVAVGTTTTVDVRVENVANLYGAEVQLVFNPAVLEVVDTDASREGVQIQPGTLLNPDFMAKNNADPATGRIVFAVSQMPPHEPVNGSGTLATITFRGKAGGISEVSFSTTQPTPPAILSDREGTPISAGIRGGSITVTGGPTPTITGTPIPTETPTPAPERLVEAEWPEKMEIGHSDYVRVSLVQTAGGNLTLTVEGTKHTAVAATALPVGGTPEAPTEGTFDPPYKACALAELAGTTFEIEPLGTACQSLDQDRITWYWNIVPLASGRQIINAHVAVRWQATDDTGSTVERPIWDVPLAITVERPWIKTDQLSIFTLVSAFLSSALSVPWLYERIKEAAEKRQKEKTSRPRILVARR